MRDLFRYCLVALLARWGRRVEGWSFRLDRRWAVGFWRVSRGGES
jgi:hypothetical protein